MGKAQNLVMNPSFEEYYTCPIGISHIEECKHVFNPVCANSSQGCNSNPDYFNICADLYSKVNVPNTYYNTPASNYRSAKQGEAFIGIANGIMYSPIDGQFSSSYREFVQIKLTTPLLAGKKYDFSFYAGTNRNKITYNIEVNQLGIHFVNDSIIYQNMPIWHFMNADWVSNEYITDSTGWQKLSGTYTANGG